VLRNGLYFVADEAARTCGEPLALRYRESLILGSLREDVIVLPFVGFTEYPSFRHFGGRGLPGGYVPLLWPGPRWAARQLYRKAIHLGRATAYAAAFVQLGRVVHVLTDMSIPSHVHRAAHDSDPFEWWVEGNLQALRNRAVEDVALPTTPEKLVESLARRAAKHAPDRTHTPLGRLLHRAGFRARVSAPEAKAQALELIPLAVGHTRALLRLFARDLSQA
jgi:hypothetical protein